MKPAHEMMKIAAISLATVVGYSLLCGAIAILAGRWITPVGGWLLVGALNLVVGGIGLKVALARLSSAERVSEMPDEVETQTKARFMQI